MSLAGLFSSVSKWEVMGVALSRTSTLSAFRLRPSRIIIIIIRVCLFEVISLHFGLQFWVVAMAMIGGTVFFQPPSLVSACHV